MTAAEPELPRFARWLRPSVDAVARVKTGVHKKLLFGFLAGALLLVAMAILSLVVIRQMNDRMAELNRARLKSERAQEMLYTVTAQSHYRAMALLLDDDSYNGKVETEKAKFSRLLGLMEQDEPTNAVFYDRVSAENEKYKEQGQQVLALFEQGDVRRRQRPSSRSRASDLTQLGGRDERAHRSGQPGHREGAV